MSNVRPLHDDPFRRLLRYAAALTRDTDQALDLVEDTVLEAFEQRHWPRGIDLRVWLLTILHDQRRNPFRQAVPMADPTTPVSSDPAASLTLSDFDRALGELPEEERAVILLVGLENMPYGKVAAILRISTGTVCSRLARGREKLRHALAAAHDGAFARAA
jgi:RNA polymerase sigma-70 factor (ECF subfamily)